jgi:teichuronic acid exporter
MSVMPEPGAHSCHTVEKGLSTSGNPVQPAENEDLASRATERRSLKRKAFLGLSWQTTNTVSRQVLTFATGIVLARLLTPAEFGLINMAVIATTWVGILGGLGIETSLIQRPALEDGEVDAGFWIAGGVGLLSAGTLVAVSPLVGRFYESPLLTDILYVYSLSLLLGGLNVVPSALIRRSLDFKAVAKVEILGTLTSGCVAVLLVAMGIGAISIPWGGVAGLLASLLVYRRMGLWRIPPFPKHQLMKRVARFSSFLAGSRALVLLRIYVDNALVGKFLGAQNLGYYSLGYNLVSVPEYRVVGLVTSIAFPALSTLKRNTDDIGRAYLRMLKYTIAVVTPLLIGLLL